jgi:hypothetical protein
MFYYTYVVICSSGAATMPIIICVNLACKMFVTATQNIVSHVTTPALSSRFNISWIR